MQLNNLRNIRRDRGISQADLGRRVGVSQGRIASIEGGTSIGQANAEKLAKALLCDVTDLVQPEEPTLTFKLSGLTPEVLALLKK